MTKKRYIPALKFGWLTHFYDPLMKLTRSEEKFKKYLLRQANINDDDTILDFGCGTGTLTIMAKKEVPNTIVHGLDIDPNVLKIAQSKVEKNGYNVVLKLYDGSSLPYKNEMFDKVLSTIVFHHMNRNQKLKALEEIYRTLKFGGELHIADFGKAKNTFMRGMFLTIQFLDGFENTSDHVNGLLPEIIEDAGFHRVIEYKRINTLVGTISFYKTAKPM